MLTTRLNGKQITLSEKMVYLNKKTPSCLCLRIHYLMVV